MSSKTLVRALAFQASRSFGRRWRKARLWCVFSCCCLTNGYRFPSAEPFQRLLSSAVDPACDTGKKAEGCASAGRPASTANPLKPHKSSSRVGVCRTAQLLYRRGGFSRQSSAVARQKDCRSVSIRQPVVRSPLTEDELRSVEQLYREIG